MSVKLTVLAAATALAMILPASTVFAQDAMAPDAMATDAMAMDAMAPMSDGDLAMCLEQAQAITFEQVAMVAGEACHTLHNGHSPMMGNAMGGDAMATDAMAPAQ